MAGKNITHIEFLRRKLEETDTDVLKEMPGYLIKNSIINTTAMC